MNARVFVFVQLIEHKINQGRDCSDCAGFNGMDDKLVYHLASVPPR